MRKLGFMEPNRSKVKFLSTSRPYDDIRRGFRRVKNHLPIIHLGGEDEDEVKKISQEINLVIQHRVHQIGIEKDLQPDECTFVEEQLTSIPQRTYLWVCLTLDVIQKTPGFTRGGVRNAVGQIPETLDEAYERILERSADKNKARKVLHIITAAVSPLSIGQMSVALAVRENHRSFEDLQEELEPLARFQNTIRDLCGLFIIIVDSKIYFLHQTAKDFLVSTETTPFLQEPPLRQHDRRSSQRGDATLFLKWKHSLQPKSSHRVLAKSCIWFLKLITSGRPLRRFMRYSAMNWATHFREAGINSTETMTQIALKICNPDSEEYQIWFKLQEDPFNCLSLSINSLFVASCLGIEALVELLLEKGADIEAADPQGRTPLWMAVCSGHEEITRLLLKKGAKIDVRCEGETLLSEAILSRNETAIRLLLERGAKLDMRSSLFLAASVGNIMIARILLKMGAEIDRKNDEGDTPLALAALSGEVEMIRMLLEKGAEVDTKNNSGKTALLYAARNGDEIVARMLLEKGADVDAKDNNGETALFYAAENGEEIVAKLLLEVGAEVDAKDNNGETALFCVAKNGKEIVARMLLKLGTGFDTTPLYSAIMYEREAVVKLLLRKGANVNARNNNGESPLSMAASLADDKIARLLKDWNPRKRFS
ncbi:MAG: hypothetical protein LQ340_000673 [Diploschistes diacapsis]|nr:MAG: hypothetical protein LQ340_000673 [Diploschistes diacapsis]